MRVQELEISTDERIEAAKKALREAQKDLESAVMDKEKQINEVKRKGRRYRAQLRATEHVMRERGELDVFRWDKKEDERVRTR
jgi:uncharacterized protein YlxW (UPF0749 family)